MSAPTPKLDDATLCRFVMEDFPSLTPREREMLRDDPAQRHKLEAMFLVALGDWCDAADNAVEAWRNWRDR